MKMKEGVVTSLAMLDTRASSIRGTDGPLTEEGAGLYTDPQKPHQFL